jgi:hypothetical protein
MSPQQQNGNWLLEHGTATFADGRKVELVDAYFSVGEDRGASITVQSILPAAPAAPVQSAPAIDWNAGRPKALDESDTSAEEKKKRGSVGGWLAEFLGLKSAATNKDLAQRTGLKVILGSDRKT